MKVVGMVPARLESSRLPNKALADIMGLPMVVHTCLRAKMAKRLDEVFLVTDSEKICDIATSFNIKTIMTSTKHKTGTERIAEAAREIECDVVVNIQGDEPLVYPHHIDSIVDGLLSDTNLKIAIGVTPFSKMQSVSDIKAVLDLSDRVMYCSRNDIPSDARTSNPAMLKMCFIVPFRREFLFQFCDWGSSPLEAIEYNEFLRVIEHGVPLKAVRIDGAKISVDTARDLDEVRRLMIRDTLRLQYMGNMPTGHPQKKRVLISAPAMIADIDSLQPIFEKNNLEPVILPVTESLRENDLLNIIGDVDGAICGDDQFNKRVLERASRLKVLSKWGVGIDSIDLKAAKQLGIVVKNTPGIFADSVADSVLAYILSFARNTVQFDRDVRSFQWQKRKSISLHECILGIIGVGSIGKAVIKRVRSFGMTVLGNDIRQIDEGFLKTSNTEMVSLNELLKRSDFISVNCTLDQSSFHLISTSSFNLMKGSAVLINTARGPIIDEKALIEALKCKKIGGAALDVFEQEPLPEDSDLRMFDNVLLAPHNSNGSPSVFRKVHEKSIENLLEVLC